MKLVLGINSLRTKSKDCPNIQYLQELMKDFPYSGPGDRLYFQESGRNIALVYEGDQQVFQSKLLIPLATRTFKAGMDPNRLPVLHYKPDDKRLNWYETERSYMYNRASEDEIWNWLFPRPEVAPKPRLKNRVTHKPGDAKPRNANGGIEARKQELTKTTIEETDYRKLWHNASLCQGLAGLLKYVDDNVPDTRLAAELTPERAKRVRVLRNIAQKYMALLGDRKTCTCGKKPATECGPDDEWEPGCDLGNNPDHAKPATVELSPSKL